jgi:hypothetical protein
MPELSKVALQVDSNQSFPNNNNGYITPAILRSYNTNVIDSTVNQIQYTADSGSWNSKIGILNGQTGSYATTGSNTFRGNQIITGSVTATLFVGDGSGITNVIASTPALNAYTASQDTKNATLATYTGSVDTKFTTIGSSTASLNSYTQSQDTKNSTLASYTASIDTKNSTLGTYTASVDQKFSNLGSQSGSFVTESETGSFARTNGSNIFTTTQRMNDDLIVSGTIYAYKINTTIESASVIFSSGSNILGDSTSDTQTLNGIVIISGSQQVTGSIGVSGDVTIVNGNSLTTSTIKSLTSAGLIISSSSGLGIARLGSGGGQQAEFLGQISSSNYAGFGNATTYSASVDSRLVAEEATSSLFTTKFSTLGTYTGSIDTKFTTLSSSTSSLNTYTASLITAFTASGTNVTVNGTTTLKSNLFVTGGVFQNIVPIIIASSTASLDFSQGTYFTLTLADNTTTHIKPTTLSAGVSATLVITTGTNSSASLAPTMLQPSGFSYSATPTSGKIDVLSLVSSNTTNIFVVSAKNMI